jgi:hypothetical protein
VIATFGVPALASSRAIARTLTGHSTRYAWPARPGPGAYLRAMSRSSRLPAALRQQGQRRGTPRPSTRDRAPDWPRSWSTHTVTGPVHQHLF